MDYNQQRRSRGGYGVRRPGNPSCGCQPSQGNPEAARPGNPGCGCPSTSSRPGNPGCGCQSKPSRPGNPGCDCQSKPSRPGNPGCDCQSKPSRPSNSGCDCQSKPEKPDCGCGQARPATTCIDSFEIAMAYVPWQSWKCTYDPHRSLMSGTIFPELDKPFCAAGRCSR